MEASRATSQIPMDKISHSIPEILIDRLPVTLNQVLAQLPQEILAQVEEIRLRQDRPLMVRCHCREYFVNYRGISEDSDRAYRVTSEDVQKTVQVLTGSSLYACEEELRQGYITIAGGHRVGLSGSVVVRDSRVDTIREIGSLNIRLAREFPGTAMSLLPRLLDSRTREVMHTILVSPPRCGKTTLLRDLVRLLSNGVPELGLPGKTVGVVDERSEIAGSYLGVPQLDVGIRTDVLDGCPKAQGMMMLLRAMGPEVIAADEIGCQADFSALEEVVNGGVKVVATLHGSNLSDLLARPGSRQLVEMGIFERIVFLSRNGSVGAVEKIYDARGGCLPLLKLLGASLVIGACTLAGRNVARAFAGRPRQLRIWQSVLLELETEIVCGAVPIGQALRRLKDRGDPLVGRFFGRVVTALEASKGGTLAEAWHQALEGWQGETYLTGDDVAILASLGNTLGTSNRADQQKHLVLAREKLAQGEIGAWEVAGKMVKPWNYFGLLGGVVIVLILI